ncbi:MAG TPA: DUF1990 family protein [Longimicrobiales bacterium]|nr:DUF1990 family protein [Longimicrobiales bacterium]
MRILITGGTGLIGQSTCSELGCAGQTVTTLARGESADWHASITDVAALEGAASACDVVIHIAGIATESPPDNTFEKMNIEGTRNLLREAERAGVKRFIYVSSLGAQRGKSDYHASKREAEALVRASSLHTTVVRPGNVYGPGDEVISTLVTYVRTLPLVPLIDDGDHPFQPVWHEDVGAALAKLVSAETIAGEYDLAGPDVITMNQLLDLLAELTGREPRRITIPSGIVGFAARMAAAAGIDLPITADTLQMMLDGNYLREGEPNGLVQLGITPTPLREGIQQLLQTLPEQTIDEGIGTAKHRIIRARIKTGSNAKQLFSRFVNEWHQFLAVETNVEQDEPAPLHEDDVVTLALPLKGNISVRVLEARDNAVTLVTLKGHPLAGFVRFTFKDESGDVVFEVNVYDRPASAIDAIAMTLGGSYAQKSVWNETARRVGAIGDSVEIENETHDLSERDVERVQEWLDKIILRRLNKQDRIA